MKSLKSVKAVKAAGKYKDYYPTLEDGNIVAKLRAEEGDTRIRKGWATIY